MPDGALSRTESFAGKALFVAALAVGALLIYALRHVLLLAFGAILIAVGVRGLASAIERRSPVNKRWSLALSALVIIGAIGGLFWLLGSQIAAQVAQLTETLPEAWANFRARISGYEAGAVLLREVQAAAAIGEGQFGAYAARLGRFTMSFAGASLELLLVIVAAAFLATSPRSYRDGALALVPRANRSHLTQALDASARALRKWLLGTLFSMAFLAVTLTFGLWALGVPSPLALGLLGGAAQFIPILGPTLAALPGILLALTVGGETALWATLLYFGASQVEANLLTPLIQKRAVSLPPALTLFAVIGFGLLLGPLGIFFAVPLTVVASVFIVIFYVRGVLGDHQARVPGD